MMLYQIVTCFFFLSMTALSKESIFIYDESSFVFSLEDKKILYEKNAKSHLNPASVTKLLTTGIALSTLGSSHRFKTNFFYTGIINQIGEIQGDLIIKGFGDPFLVSQDLFQIASDLKHMGISSINGDLLIDQDFFYEEKESFDRIKGQEGASSAYEAPVSALGVNFNTVAVAVAPGLKAGNKPFVSMDPLPLEDYRIDNRAVTKQCKKSSIQVIRDNNSLKVTGAICLGFPIEKYHRGIGDPILGSGSYFRAFFKNIGIPIQGKIKKGSIKGAKFLFSYESKPIHELIQKINFYSNNYMADSIFKSIGSGLYQGGKNIVSDFFKKNIPNAALPNILNGSGLTSENRVSAHTIVSFLDFMEKNKDIFPDFWASLPASRLTGTLKKRFEMFPAGHIRAKTGGLSDPVTVVALAGYMPNPAGKGLIAFAIFLNGKRGLPQPPRWEFQKKQEDLLSKLLFSLSPSL
jgi:D-alanyl-D-alanine carboxypeptidase/D-alanyl-D-alanine-endopeptidase (penicillin-binding protein 4)